MTGKNFREAVGGLTQIPHPDASKANKGLTVDAVANMKKFRDIK